MGGGDKAVLDPGKETEAPNKRLYGVLCLGGGPPCTAHAHLDASIILIQEGARGARAVMEAG